MRISKILGWSYAALLSAAASAAFAQQDVKGSSDHPLLTRYPGFTISKYASVEFDKAEIMVGPAFVDENNKRQLDLMSVEGAVTNIKYSYGGEDVSTYALFANYRKALEAMDADIIFSCEGPDECGMHGVFINNMVNDKPAAYRGFRVNIPEDFAILTGTVSNSETFAHIMIALGTHPGTGRRYVNQSIITSAALETDKLGIGSLGDLTKGLEDTGSIVLDGVLFDFDTADLKSESEPVLSVLREFLVTSPDVSVFIVGHSDDTGAYEYNVELSQRRASAVVADLVARGIPEARMKAIGIGPVSPVAKNDTPEGQALNRRVEMVVQ
ncbi:OmpA family protein [Aliishimia ponticola]|nr:OmpA family protein [Aliishimia ponticola]